MVSGGGVVCAILVAKTCIALKTEDPVLVLKDVFERYSNWAYPDPISLPETEPQNTPTSVTTWNAKENVGDNCQHMVVLTPHPVVNTCSQITECGYQVIVQNLKETNQVIKNIYEGKASWTDIFINPQFFVEFK